MGSSTSAVAGKSVLDQHLPADVLAFCRQHNLLDFVDEAVRLVENSFSPAAAPAIVLDEDYETGEKRVVIEVVTEKTADEAVEQYDAYVRQWVAFATPDARSRVSLSLDVRGGHGPA